MFDRDEWHLESRTRTETLLDVLRDRVQSMPEKILYTCISREAAAEQITFSDLDVRARRLAYQLRSIAKGEERVLLLYPDGVDYIVGLFACFHARLIAVSGIRSQAVHSLERFCAVVRDSQAGVVLGPSRLLGEFQTALHPGGSHLRLKWVASDRRPEGPLQYPDQPNLDGQSLALLQYTSGSTQSPRGVMLSHGNLLHNLAGQFRAFDYNQSEVGVSWLPLSHDMGLIGGALMALYGGAHCILMSPSDFLEQPVRWLQAITDYRATISGAPNFAYDLCVRRVTAEQKKRLDLSSWSVAFNGAEFVRHENVTAFNEAFRDCGFRPQAMYPCYGLAEATLFVAGGARTTECRSIAVRREDLNCNRAAPLPIGADGPQTGCIPFVSCGRSLQDQQITIVDESRRLPCTPGQIGEIWIRGPSVAQGYFGRPEESQHTFEGRLRNGEGPFLRTGDLGFMWDGELFVAGRLKDIIIIRGVNHYPEDIEATVERCHGAIVRGANAAVTIEAEGEERLVLVQEIRRDWDGDPASVLERIIQEIKFEHAIDPHAVLLIRQGALPRTPSGKVQRGETRAAVASGQLETVAEWRSGEAATTSAGYVSPQTVEEEALAKIWAEVLGLEKVSTTDNFFFLGGHSLVATRLIARIRDVFAVELPVSVLFEAPTLRELAGRVAEAKRAGTGVALPPLVRCPRDNVSPLSYAQERLWFLDQLGVSSAYNIPAALRLHGQLNVTALEHSFAGVVRRHEILRTRFEAVDGQGVQMVDAAATFRMELVDLSRAAEREREAQIHQLASADAERPFDLAAAPLMRAKLVRLSATEHVVFLNIHHIVADGWSIGVMIREIAALYAAHVENCLPALCDLPIQYADYALWQRGWLKAEALDRQISYWKERLAWAPTALQLPIDRVRPAVQSFRGDSYSFRLSQELSSALVQLGQREGATLFMVLLAAFQLLLGRYSGQEDIVVGCPIAGRRRQELEQLIGFFVNTLVMRADLSGEPSFRELLHRVRRSAIDAYAHQDLPFEKLVEELQPARDLSRQPLFQVMFTLQELALGQLDVAGLRVTQMRPAQQTTKFDLTLFLHPTASGLQGSLEYATDLFERDTIERLVEHFTRLLQEIAADPDRRISELPLLCAEERQRLLVEWNNTAADYVPDTCVHELFAEQAARQPDAIALGFEGVQLSYGELERRANQLAHHLRALGVGPETVVGLCLARSISAIVGLLGILKAGGAYLPLDPSYPPARLAYMLSDAHARVLVTEAEHLRSLPPHEALVVRIDADWEEIARHPSTAPISGTCADNLAYVIYTSGSTGSPKGVEVVHRGITRLVLRPNYADLRSDDVFLLMAPLAFDASTFEIWGALLNGAKLIVYPETWPDIARLKAVICDEKVSVLWLTAGLFHRVVDDDLSVLAPIRLLLAGGDALSPAHVLRAAAGLSRSRLINGYGPTEGTTFSVCFPVPRRPCFEASVPIGRPITQTQAYVLDALLEPVPPGVAGELYIGGLGLARGYVGRASRTAERFVPNPFGNGDRLYRTGDLVRYLADGNLEFLGRLDHQVKVRGYRIELGEIEAALLSQPGVDQAVVVARHDGSAEKRLVAYVVPDRQRLKELWPQDAAARDESTTEWQALFDQTYDQAIPAGPSFVGWNSSYTGEPIPECEMREWLDCTIGRIRALRPTRLLEIGCGVGLLLQHLAPDCRTYLGTDISGRAIAGVRRWIERSEALRHVELMHRSAADFTGIDDGSVDTVVLNSVVQYFPDIDYLIAVLERAVKSVAPGGHVFIGDVRHLGLLSMFHSAVQLSQAPAGMNVGQLRSRIARALSQERELAIDPEFFLALADQLPTIGRVELMLKRGGSENELTRYRYDVTLHAGEKPSWLGGEVLEWRVDERTPAELAADVLREKRPPVLRMNALPNRRLARERVGLRLIETLNFGDDVEEVRAAMAADDGAGEGPEAFWELGEAHGYAVRVSWTPGSCEGCFDVLFADESQVRLLAAPSGHRSRPARAWSSYANDPSAGALTQHLPSQLREALKQRLPDYMVPSAFLVLDWLPLTANGKVDRRALPAPEERAASTNYVPPRSPVERQLASIWCEVLRLDQVGVNDNFFGLGGDSIQSIQVAARANRAGLKLTVRQIFDHQTIAALAAAVQPAGPSSAEQGMVQGDVPLTPIERWFFEQDLKEPQHFNQALLLECRVELSPALLGEAINRVAAHHDALRLRFRREEAGWLQRYADCEGEVVLEHVELSAVPRQEQAAALTRAADQLQASLDISAGPLMRAALFGLGTGQRQRLLMVIHHLVIDAVSWRILIEDLHSAYGQLTRGGQVELPAKTTSFKDWAERLVAYAQSPAAHAEIGYWGAVPWGRSGLLPVDHSNGVNTVASARTVLAHLSVAETGALLRAVPTTYHTHVQEVLVAALVEACADWTGHRALLIELEGHGREDLFDDADVSRTVGWFTSLFPVLLDVNAATDPGSVLKTIKEQLRAIPSRGIGYGVLRYLSGTDALPTTAAPEISFNYLGQLDHGMAETLPFLIAREGVGLLSSSKNGRRHLIDVDASIQGESLQLQWTFSTAIHEQATIETLAQGFIRQLRRLIAHCRTSEGGYTPSDFPLIKIDQAGLDRIIEAAGGARSVEDIYPLSPLQQGILFHSLYETASPVYFETLSCCLKGALNEEAFEQAWRWLVERHAILRTTFLGRDLEVSLQVVLRRVELPFVRHDWRDLPHARQEAQLQELEKAERERGFEFSAPPLMRVSLVRVADAEYRLVLSNHHILYDGWSQSILLNEIFAAYEAFVRRDNPRTQPVRPYRDYIAWLQRQDIGRAEAYWRNQLSGLDAPTLISLDRPVPDPLNERSEKRPYDYTFALTVETLEAFAHRHKLTVNTILQAAWALLLSRYSGTQDVVFAVTSSGRPAELPDVERTVGLFINTLPLRIRVQPERVVSAWLRELQLRQVEQFEYQYSSLAQVQRCSPLPAGTPLFETIFVFENYPFELPAAADGQSIEIGDLHHTGQTNYPLALIFRADRDLSLRVTYDTRRFAGRAIAQLVGHFESLLEAIVAEPDRKIGDLSMLSEAEGHRLLVEWNDTETEYPPDKGVHELFAEIAARTPDAVAVEDGRRTVRYGELDEWAARVAAALRALGLRPGAAVGLSGRRSAELIAGMLGILKAGAFFVPLDPSYPTERLEFMAEDGALEAVVLGPDGNAPDDVAAIRVNELPAAGGMQAASPGGEAAAYMVYTSGSTGVPKGIVVPHRAITRLVLKTNYIALGPEDRVAHLASPSFDATTFEVWGALLHGGTVVIFDRNTALSPQALAAGLVEKRISSMFVTTALFNRLVQDAPGVFATVRNVLFGGEAVDPSAVNAALCDWPPGRLLHVYGPTEVTTFSTWHDVTEVPLGAQTVPIGKALANGTCYVLDQFMEPVPVGVAGELYLGGAGLAHGYWRRAALTAERFVANPFGSPGSRLYRTGDLVRYLGDGNLEFLGRIDGQVKLRGHRIELGEIEAKLLSHRDVAQAVVVMREDTPGDKRLVAYVVGREQATADVRALRPHLQTSLPDYMVPSSFVFLGALPLTANGKVDRAALPVPEAAFSMAAYVAPRTPLEETLASIWREVLKAERIGINDDFFELGGDSIKSIQAVARANHAGLKLTISELFGNPTISGLAESIGRAEEGVVAGEVREPQDMHTTGRSQEFIGEKDDAGMHA